MSLQGSLANTWVGARTVAIVLLRCQKHVIDALRGMLFALGSVAVAQLALATDVLPQTDPPFKGKIGFSAKDSVPDWPKPVQAPPAAPNIVLILLDDAGFGASSTFGGPAQT